MQHSNHQLLKKLPAAWRLLGELGLKPIKNYLTSKTIFGPGYQVNEVSIDLARLARYEKLCGFTPSDFLPITYPHVLAFRLQLHTVLATQAPFSPLGLIHLSNRITQFKAISKQQLITLTTHIEKIIETKLGPESTLITQAFVNNECVWQEESIFLNKKPGFFRRQMKSPEKILSNQTESWIVPANTGRRYAQISEDFNPIHLYDFSARLLGFKQAIAHGMWTKARCLAALNVDISKPLEVTVDFKIPIFLPAALLFQQQHRAEDIVFSVSNNKKNKPHLFGSLRQL